MGNNSAKLGQYSDVLETRIQSFGKPFVSWPLFKPTPLELASAGFVFEPTKKKRDRCRCTYCHKTVRNWDAKHDPQQQHIIGCKFLAATTIQPVVEKAAEVQMVVAEESPLVWNGNLVDGSNVQDMSVEQVKQWLIQKGYPGLAAALCSVGVNGWALCAIVGSVLKAPASQPDQLSTTVKAPEWAPLSVSPPRQGGNSSLSSLITTEVVSHHNRFSPVTGLSTVGNATMGSPWFTPADPAAPTGTRVSPLPIMNSSHASHASTATHSDHTASTVAMGTSQAVGDRGSVVEASTIEKPSVIDKNDEDVETQIVDVPLEAVLSTKGSSTVSTQQAAENRSMLLSQRSALANRRHGSDPRLERLGAEARALETAMRRVEAGDHARLDLADGVYVGEALAGAREGFGRLDYNNGDAFVGAWREDCRHGFGVMISAGGTYMGFFANGKREGFGKLTWANGDVYAGIWRDGARNGEGTWASAQGNSYYGGWCNDHRQGYGMFRWSNGDVYEGQWVQDRMHGEGGLAYASGNVYLGEFVDDAPHGHGRFSWAGSDVYEGPWIKGEMRGEGRIRYANGDVYVGSVGPEGREGWGRLTSTEVGVYEGWWRGDVRNGWGHSVDVKGAQYWGEWVNDLMHGWGALVDEAGVRRDGMFDKGNFVHQANHARRESMPAPGSKPCTNLGTNIPDHAALRPREHRASFPVST